MSTYRIIIQRAVRGADTTAWQEIHREAGEDLERLIVRAIIAADKEKDAGNS